VTGFGSNPGNLRMLTYVPDTLVEPRALVVVLHGCTQTAASYDYGTGWSTLADRYGFAVLFPEQKRANNPLRCFNWFKADDTARGRGEPLSIKEMVERMIATHKIDPARVFITGVSAGGAMSSVMLATYPELFAGGAVIAGVPYGSANGLQEAFDTIFQGRSRPAREWGNLVRAASSHQGPWPKVSVWHGDADSTVKPLNADEIIKQWTDVHNLPLSPSRQHKVEGHLRRVWHGPGGEDLIESYTVAGMGHGVPVDQGDKEHQCGRAGPFILDVGISSTWHIARSWELTELRREARAAPEHPAQPAQPPEGTPDPRPATARDDKATPSPDLAAVISAWHRQHGEQAGRAEREDASSFQDRRAGTERSQSDAPRGIDLQAILTKSFELAGLATKFGTSSAHAGSGGGLGGGIDIQAILAKSFELASLAKSFGEAGGTKNRADPPENEHRDDKGDGESGWQGEGWQFLAESLGTGEGEGSVLFGQVSSGINGDGGNKVRTVSRRMFLGQRPSLSYRRRLDLAAAVNMYTSAAFTVLVDGVVVDEVSTMGMDYAESTWTERSGIDLAEFADRTVTLSFQVAANTNVRADVTAKAWVAGIAVEDAGGGPAQ
jgi:feruloyl esterase